MSKRKRGKVYGRTTPLMEYVDERYFLERSLRRGSQIQYRQAVRMLSDWLGRPARMRDLEDDTLNAFLAGIEKGYSARYVRGRKTHLVAIAKSAAEDGIIAAPKRIRRVVPAHTIPEAWTAEQIGELLAATGVLSGRYPQIWNCRQRDWWDLAIRIAWDTGLRKGDQLAIARNALTPDGWVILVQAKTGKQLPPRLLAKSTLERVDAFLPIKRQLLCPWHHSQDYFCQHFQDVVRAAGLTGTWHKLRRSSGTAVEIANPGHGAVHLGDTEEVFRQHYLDPRLLGRGIPGPPELPPTEGKADDEADGEADDEKGGAA